MAELFDDLVAAIMQDDTFGKLPTYSLCAFWKAYLDYHSEPNENREKLLTQKRDMLHRELLQHGPLAEEVPSAVKFLKRDLFGKIEELNDFLFLDDGGEYN